LLKVETRFLIKDLYRKGVTISEIARISGHSRRTIRAIINGPVNPPPRKWKARARKIDPFIGYPEKRMAGGVFNCRKLLEEIQRQGYQGCRSPLKSFVQPYRQTRRQEATVRFETEPDEQTQVDWAHCGFIEHQGRRRRLYTFLMTLGWSPSLYLEFTVSDDAAWWLRCHVHALHYFDAWCELAW